MKDTQLITKIWEEEATNRMDRRNNLPYIQERREDDM